MTRIARIPNGPNPRKRTARRSSHNGVDVKDSDGTINIPFTHPLARKIKNYPITNLPKFVRFLHSLDIHVIARQAFFRDDTPPLRGITRNSVRTASSASCPFGGTRLHSLVFNNHV